MKILASSVARSNSQVTIAACSPCLSVTWWQTMLLNGPTCARSESQTSGSLVRGKAAFIWSSNCSLDLVELASDELIHESFADGFEILSLCGQ